MTHSYRAPPEEVVSESAVHLAVNAKDDTVPSGAVLLGLAGLENVDPEPDLMAFQSQHSADRGSCLQVLAAILIEPGDEAQGIGSVASAVPPVTWPALKQADWQR